MKKFLFASPKRSHSNGMLLSIALTLNCVVVGPALAANAPRADPANGVKNAAARQLVSDGLKAFEGGDRRLGVTLFKRALDASPGEGLVQFALGRAEFLTGDAASAERHLRLALSNGIPDGRVLPSLLDAMIELREENKLLSEFPTPAASAKGSVAAEILRGRAMAMLSLGRVDEAATSMDRSLELDRSSTSLLNRATIAARQNNASQATEFINEAFKRDSKNGHVLLAKLDDLLQHNDNNGALALSQQILQRAPNDITTRAARIEIFLRTNQVSRANGELQLLLAVAPGVPLVQYYNALVLARTNNLGQAWKIAQALPARFSRLQPDYALNLSQLAIDSGYVDTGAAILAGAVSTWPNEMSVRLRLASVRMRQGIAPEALRLLEPIKDTNDPQALDTLGLARLQTGDSKGALDVMQRASQIQPQNPQITFHLAQAMNQSGDRIGAKNLLKKLLASGRQFDDLGSARKLESELRQ